MHYDKMTQLALRGVVRDAIRRVIRDDGLPGAHHFYISFLTRYPGVDIDESLAKKYTDEITIVIEHQYWDLKAHDDSFEVTLKFGGVPKYISVPYTAITRFHDPSVGFSMQFDPPEEMQDNEIVRPPTLAKLKTAPVKPRAVKGKPVKAPKAKPVAKATKTPAKAPVKTAAKKTKTPKDESGTVVSLDSFRKK